MNTVSKVFIGILSTCLALALIYFVAMPLT